MAEKTHCRCGSKLEYPEELYNNTCWCCAVRKGRDIGARYYYSVGIWRKYPRRKFFNKGDNNEKITNDVGVKSSAPRA